MKFDLIIRERGLPGTATRAAARVGVLLDDRTCFGGERVSVDWSTARRLLAAGQGDAAPGVVVPLASPERAP